jgi:hypothetical protein
MNSEFHFSNKKEKKEKENAYTIIRYYLMKIDNRIMRKQKKLRKKHGFSESSPPKLKIT